MKVYVNLDGLYKKAKKGEKIDDYEIVREIEEAFMFVVDNFLTNLGFEAAESGVYDGVWIRRHSHEIGEIEIEAVKPTPFASLVDDYIRDAIQSITEVLSQYNIKAVACVCSTLFWGYIMYFVDENGTIVERRAFNLNKLVEEFWEIIKKIQE